MWSEIPIAFWRFSSWQYHYRHLALHQSIHLVQIPPSRRIHRNPQTSTGSSLHQAIGDQVNDPCLRIRRQPIRGGQATLEHIDDHLAIACDDWLPFQRQAGEYIHSLILPVLGHALATVRAFEVKQIPIAGKAIVLDAAFQVAGEFIRALVVGSDNSQGFLPDRTLVEEV